MSKKTTLHYSGQTTGPIKGHKPEGRCLRCFWCNNPFWPGITSTALERVEKHEMICKKRPKKGE